MHSDKHKDCVEYRGHVSSDKHKVRVEYRGSNKHSAVTNTKAVQHGAIFTVTNKDCTQHRGHVYSDKHKDCVQYRGQACSDKDSVEYKGHGGHVESNIF